MLSHEVEAVELTAALEAIRGRILSEGEDPLATTAERLALLDQLAGFPFGRFLLCNRGWNGYWTHYAVVWHPRHGRALQQDPSGRPYTDLESRLLEFPACRATQERFTHFQRVLQAQVRDGVRMASVPCGLMDDLLLLDYSGDVGLVGMDLDEDSLWQAAESAARLDRKAQFSKVDAWQLPATADFDVVTSNGLNIYEPDDARVVALYRAFAGMLKPGGVLVTSHLTPPAEHDLSSVDAESLRFQKVVLGSILQVKWSCFRTVKTTTSQLKEAGFEVTEVILDAARMFPTFVARKI